MGAELIWGPRLAGAVALQLSLDPLSGPCLAQTGPMSRRPRENKEDPMQSARPTSNDAYGAFWGNKNGSNQSGGLPRVAQGGRRGINNGPGESGKRAWSASNQNGDQSQPHMPGAPGARPPPTAGAAAQDRIPQVDVRRESRNGRTH